MMNNFASGMVNLSSAMMSTFELRALTSFVLPATCTGVSSFSCTAVRVPFLLSRLVMMLGNWTQHAFVDLNDPENMYRNCYTCINTSYNQKCWNDGYHLMHHLRPGAHYTEMPALFVKEKEMLAKEKSLVFEGIHYLHLFYFLMTIRYDKIADNLVNINNSFSSREEAINVLKQRTAKFCNPRAA